MTIKKQANNKVTYELSKLKVLIKIAKIIGVIFLILGLIANPFVIESLFDSNGDQQSFNTFKFIGVFLFFFGLFLMYIDKIHTNILLLICIILRLLLNSSFS